MGIWAIIRDMLFLPPGYTLIDVNEHISMRIRGDQFSHHHLVVRYDDVSYVRTGERDDDGFLIYREDHLTHDYGSATE